MAQIAVIGLPIQCLCYLRIARRSARLAYIRSRKVAGKAKHKAAAGCADCFGNFHTPRMLPTLMRFGYAEN